MANRHNVTEQGGTLQSHLPPLRIAASEQRKRKTDDEIKASATTLPYLSRRSPHGRAATLHTDTPISGSPSHTAGRMRTTSRIREKSIRYDTISEDRSSGERRRLLSALSDRNSRLASVFHNKELTRRSDHSPKSSGANTDSKHGMHSETSDNAAIQGPFATGFDYSQFRPMNFITQHSQPKELAQFENSSHMPTAARSLEGVLHYDVGVPPFHTDAYPHPPSNAAFSSIRPAQQLSNDTPENQYVAHDNAHHQRPGSVPEPADVDWNIGHPMEHQTHRPGFNYVYPLNNMLTHQNMSSMGRTGRAPLHQHRTFRKQSKWSAYEDSRIISLRMSGMDWPEIARHLPGRSAISCRLRYQNKLEKHADSAFYSLCNPDIVSRMHLDMALPVDPNLSTTQPLKALIHTRQHFRIG